MPAAVIEAVRGGVALPVPSRRAGNRTHGRRSAFLRTCLRRGSILVLIGTTVPPMMLRRRWIIRLPGHAHVPSRQAMEGRLSNRVILLMAKGPSRLAF